ncbi:hypothetical protein Leryth_009391 [Lithospermum erythrorhizon]|nr:hypothetical protein Leryth_009391 [Lithospermum erythrorhizon]
MEQQKQKICSNIDVLGEDVVHKILEKLPALSCGSAACVCRLWNRIITSRILSVPKLLSAFSLNSSLQDAVREVFEKVLSEPIRPQFAIASVGPDFDLKQAHKLITERLDSQIPVITSASDGILGREALTSKFREIQWDATEDSDDDSTDYVKKRGILLTVGYLPGLRASLVPLQGKKELPELLMDRFVMDICEWSSSVSNSSSPAGVILFTDYDTDMKPVLAKMEYALSKETVVVGDGGGQFLYQSDKKSNSSESSEFYVACVALLFANDQNTPPGLGKTQFHLMLSAGVSPIGPVYKAASVNDRKNDNSTWITARRESSLENLDGQTILDEIHREIGEPIIYPALYIGVTKRRKCSVGTRKARWLTFHEFHEVLSGDEEYLYVHDKGIKTGDSFCFYMSNIDVARSTCRSVSDNFRSLKQCHDRDFVQDNIDRCNKKHVFGGILFSCCGRGEQFFGESNVDSLPFLENFPEVPLAGTFSAGEIGRANMSVYGKESLEEMPIPCSFHVFSSVYLVMSYTPPVTQQ